MLDSAATTETISRVYPEITEVRKPLTELYSASFLFLTFSSSNVTQFEGLHTTFAAEDEACVDNVALDFSFLPEGPADISPFETSIKGKLYTILPAKDNACPISFTVGFLVSGEIFLNKL